MANNHLSVRGRKRRSILNAGGNRAALANVVAYRSHNARSSATTINPIYVDPALGRAENAVANAARHGVEATAIEARAEDYVEGEVVDGILANVDGAGTVDRLAAAAEARGIPMLGQLVLQLPSTRTIGFRLALTVGALSPREEARAFRDARAFCGAIQRVTARSGAAAIFGETARGRGSLIEAALRRSFAEHTEAELSRLTAGIAPEHAPLEITDGRRAVPLLVVEREAFGEPTEVVLDVAEAPAVPLRRGDVFFVAEITVAGVRLHEARRRHMDGKFAVTNTNPLDERSYLARRERPSALVDAIGARASASDRHALDLMFGLAVGVVGTALASAAKASTRSSIEALRMDTLSSTSPVLTTD